MFGKWLLRTAYFFLAAFLFLFSGCSPTRVSLEKAPEGVLFEAVDPLEKVFRETAFFLACEPEADVARGEQATLQFVVRSEAMIRNLKAEVGEFRSGAGRLTGGKAGYVGYVRIGRSTGEPARDKFYSLSGFYPDPILENPPASVAAGFSQPVWITIPVPRDAVPGVYHGTVTITGTVGGRKFREVKSCAVHVYPPVIERTRLWVTNWFSLEKDRLALMNNGRPVEPFSERYWQLVRAIARKMAEYRQNVALISPLNLAAYTVDNGRYGIDFSRFDQTVQIFIKEGVIGRIEGGHIGTRESTWLTPFVVFVPEIKGETVEFAKYPMSDERAQNFYAQFIPALVFHLKTMGWWDIYMQHLADEPIQENVASYLEIARFVKHYAPEIKIIEACHSRDLGDMLDIWVPQLNFFDADNAFYEEAAAKGDEVWFYTCVFPQGEYANRFIEQPLIKTRLLHWINFKYGSPGYLHWGFNWWTGKPFSEATQIQTESGLVLPAGDSWIVYPTEGGLLSSIRLEAMRDGIVDHELLSLLEAKRPEEARELARQVVYGFTQYDINVPAFREKRRAILKLLSE